MEGELVDGPGPRPVASLGLPRRPATYRPHIFEDHVAAGSLCQAVTDFLANHLKVIGRQADRFQIGYVDDFDRHLLLVGEQGRFVGAVGGRIRLGRALVTGFTPISRIHL